MAPVCPISRHTLSLSQRELTCSPKMLGPTPCTLLLAAIKVAQYAEGDQKVCLNMLKKDQLSVLALMKRR